MNKDQKKRLGYGGIDEVKNHPFFKGINWVAIHNLQIASPISIQLKEKGSTKYFMKYNESKGSISPPLTRDQEKLFKDF
jgi:hypothetical protein